MHYIYNPNGVCTRRIEFDIDGDIITNISLFGGCNGNSKAIAILCDGMKVSEIYDKLSGNDCGGRGTSCADQLARGVMKAYEESKNN